jgi:uncharacterized protein (UPF0303 family)
MTALTAEDLAAHDAELRFERFGHADALAVGRRLVDLATERGLAVTVGLWLGDQRVFHAAMPGTSADLDQWIDRKVALVRRYDASSMTTKLRLNGYGVTEPLPVLGLDPAQHTISGGAVPIRIHGTTVGIAVASGTDDESEHLLVVEALRAHLLDTMTG